MWQRGRNYVRLLQTGGGEGETVIVLRKGGGGMYVACVVMAEAGFRVTAISLPRMWASLLILPLPRAPPAGSFCASSPPLGSKPGS